MSGYCRLCSGLIIISTEGHSLIVPDESYKTLADAITQAVTDESIKRQAAALGENIRAEDGVAKVVELVSRYVSG